ncbi:hypothetical protein ACC696_37910, partial [Rhizobium ruizarguesonis]
LFATNPYSIDFSNRTAFFSASETLSSFSASRLEFIGKAGTIQAPQSVISSSSLSGATELDGDPAAALAIDIELSAGDESARFFFRRRIAE